MIFFQRWTFHRDRFLKLSGMKLVEDSVDNFLKELEHILSNLSELDGKMVERVKERLDPKTIECSYSRLDFM